MKRLFNPDLEVINKNFSGNFFINGQFSNSNTPEKQSLGKVLKWRFTPNPQKEEKQNEQYQLRVIKDNSFITDKEDLLVWLGHSSFFIRTNGVTILTDPVFFDLPFIKRKAELPVNPEDLKGIDYLLLSHGHRDHFDHNSLKIVLKNNPDIVCLTPLKMTPLLKKINPHCNVQEAGWYQKYKLNTSGLSIYFLPALHWHRRGLTDFNKVLWGSFWIRNAKTDIYFAGDSSHADFYKEIYQIMGSCEYCLMPIGAYKPDFLMNQYHMSPEEAAALFNELHGKKFIPMHYGTYDLADEPLGEPEEKIRSCYKNGQLRGELIVPAVGEKVFLT
ncbi:MAG TPA: MBL fold metallo-hydrolase [Cytophagaceae bacterium]